MNPLTDDAMMMSLCSIATTRDSIKSLWTAKHDAVVVPV